MLLKKETPVVAFALLLALATATEPILKSVLAMDPVLAQSPSPSPFTIPSVVPKDSKVRVDGSTSMKAINESLKKGYEQKYSGATVDFAYSGTPAALQALLDGKVDLAAIGRPLTEAEKAKGLKEVRIARHKIAMIVAPENPFKGSLQDFQFAKMFRGEIKDWSEVGGAPGPIRFIDRPEDSDTRQALRNYPVFKVAPFQSGANTVRSQEDSTEAVLKELGRDGIAYAIADQVFNQPGVRVVAMHQTLPDDPRYPFSQPLVYVYKDVPPAAVAAFLGYATAPDSQAVVAQALKNEAVGGASPAPAASPTPTATASPEGAVAPAPTPAATSTQGGGLSPWWLLLPLALLGLVWFLLGRRSTPITPDATGGAAPLPPPAGGVGGTAASDAGAAAVPPVSGVGQGAIATDAGTTAPVGDRPAPTVDQAGRGGIPGGAVIAGAAAAGAGAAAAGAGAAALAGLGGTTRRSHITLTPRDAHQAYAHWDAPDEHKAEVQAAGGQNFMLRLYDVTGKDATTFTPEHYEEFDVADWSSDRNLPVKEYNRDYVAEIGYVAGGGRWLPMARSNSIRVAPPQYEGAANENADPTSPGLAGGAGAILGGAALAGAGAALGALAGDSQSQVEATKYDVGQTDLSSEELATVDEGLPGLPEGYGESRIVLMPRDPQWGYAYWDTPDDHKQELRRQGGQRLALRIYDVTDIDISHQAPHSLQQYDCDELARDWYVRIPVSDRDYIAEIGYLTADGRWLMLARSAPCRIPPVYPSDWHEDVFATVNWDESLPGKTLAELTPPGRRAGVPATAIYDQIFGMSQSAEAMRVAGSLFGSMQHIPGSVFGSAQMVSGVSSYITPSGVGFGAGAVPTLSGLTMSGVGFSASMPPIRARKFWLIADAELIIYGATEPDATVTIGGRPIQLNPDGTFRFQMSFQDGLLDFPIMAVAADGEQTRSIHMKFTRETPFRHTNTKDEAQDEEY
jgi:ABC-type phosphate transport system substrate-binding protein